MPAPPVPLARQVAAEAIGTFALVFAGCGAVVVDATQGGLGHTGVCAVFGMVVAVMIFATGHISGAHFNPAVTLSFAALGRFAWRHVPAFVAAQVAAAIAASLAVEGLLGDAAALGATTTALSAAPALGIEAVLTFFLMFVITAVATDARASGRLAAVAIGATVAIGALVGGPLTGASLNPARTLGPALVAGVYDGLWIYFVGPVLGAVLGAFAYRFIAAGGEAG